MSVCFVCCRVFPGGNGERDMWRHVTSVHVDNKPPQHVCKLCGKGFSSHCHLTRHVVSKHGGSRGQTCLKCDRRFRTEVSLRIHLSARHGVLQNGDPIGEKTETCTHCGLFFGIIEEVYRHKYYCKLKRRRQKKALRKAERARRKSSTEGPGSSLIVGTASDSQTIPPPSTSADTVLTKPSRQKLDKSCVYCQLQCASMQSLRRHIERKHPDKVVEAEKMGKTYAAFDAPNLPFVCLDCGKRVATKASLSLHRRRVHEISLEHWCDVCWKAYPLASELKKHVKRAHGSKPVEEEQNQSVESPPAELPLFQIPEIKEEDDLDAISQ